MKSRPWAIPSGGIYIGDHRRSSEDHVSPFGDQIGAGRNDERNVPACRVQSPSAVLAPLIGGKRHHGLMVTAEEFMINAARQIVSLVGSNHRKM